MPARLMFLASRHRSGITVRVTASRPWRIASTTQPLLARCDARSATLSAAKVSVFLTERVRSTPVVLRISSECCCRLDFRCTAAVTDANHQPAGTSSTNVMRLDLAVSYAAGDTRAAVIRAVAMAVYDDRLVLTPTAHFSLFVSACSLARIRAGCGG